MARYFAGASGKITTAFTAHSTNSTWSVWYWQDGNGEGGFGKMFNKSATNARSIQLIATTFTELRFEHQWSTQDGIWAIPRPSLSAWHHILIRYDSSVTTAPTIYVDGTSQTVTTILAPTGSASTNSDPYVIGNTGSQDGTWDGRIAEWAKWDVQLDTSEITALSKGFSPLLVRPQSLSAYLPLRRQDPEPDWKNTGGAALSGFPTAFPTSAVLDSFTRADTGPPPSASWTNFTTSGLQVVSNQCAPSGTGQRGAYWTTGMTAPDVEVYTTVATNSSTAGTTYQLFARLDPAGGGGGVGDGYALFVFRGGGGSNDFFQLRRYDNSVGTDIGTGVSVSATANGDAIGLRCYGDHIESWRRVSGTWSMLESVFDNTYDGKAPYDQLALGTNDPSTTTTRFDDFGGGNVVISMDHPKVFSPAANRNVHVAPTALPTITVTGDWSFVLTDWRGQNLGEMRAFDRRLELGVSKTCTASCAIHDQDPMWSELTMGRRLKVYNPAGQLEFYGIIHSIEQTNKGSMGTASLVAADLSWTFSRRYIGVIVGGDPAEPPPDVGNEGTRYEGVAMHVVLANVINTINNGFWTGVNIGALPAASTSFADTSIAWRTIMDVLQEMSVTRSSTGDGGFVWKLRYVSDGSPPEVVLDVLTPSTIGIDRWANGGLAWQYGVGKNNVSTYTRNRSYDSYATSAIAIGNGATDTQYFTNSADESVSGFRSEVLVPGGYVGTGSTSWHAAAAREIINELAAPTETYSVSPVAGLGPRYGIDYRAGDSVRVNIVEKGAELIGTTMQVWSTNLVIDEYGRELCEPQAPPDVELKRGREVTPPGTPPPPDKPYGKDPPHWIGPPAIIKPGGDHAHIQFTTVHLT